MRDMFSPCSAKVKGDTHPSFTLEGVLLADFPGTSLTLSIVAIRPGAVSAARKPKWPIEAEVYD
jgi:hypothetical protein